MRYERAPSHKSCARTSMDSRISNRKSSLCPTSKQHFVFSRLFHSVLAVLQIKINCNAIFVVVTTRRFLAALYPISTSLFGEMLNCLWFDRNYFSTHTFDAQFRILLLMPIVFSLGISVWNNDNCHYLTVAKSFDVLVISKEVY